MKKTILITGASSGIGKATAIYFAKKGWNVAATMRDPIKEKELVNYPNIKIYTMDVTNSESIQTAINNSIRDYSRIDVLVNNAGYGADGVFEAMSDEVIQKQFDTNVFGLMRTSRAIIPHMRENKGGNIIQVASMGGRLTFPLFSIYHGTKWAVEGFSEALQYELKQFNIKIRIIEPGAIKTEFYGRSRVAVPGNELKDYKEFVEQCEVISQEAGKKGEPAAKVAETIYKAANSNNWKMRFPVGSPAPMLLWLRKHIADSIFFKLVKSSYKL